MAVEPPLNIQRKFPINKSKNDLLDSAYIAEYACRYADKLAFWKPRDEILEKVKVLLATQEQFTGQLTAQKNVLHAVNRKNSLLRRSQASSPGDHQANQKAH